MSKITTGADCSHEIKRFLLLGRKAVIKLDSLLKSKDITLLTKVRLVKWSESESCSVLSNSLQLDVLYSPWNSPGQNTGVGSLSLLQGIFPTQGLKPGIPHCRQILYQLSHQGSPRILEWVDYSFSRGSSHPRNWTRVSLIAGGSFTSWATRESPILNKGSQNTQWEKDILFNIWFWKNWILTYKKKK